MSQYEFDDLLEKYLRRQCSPQEEQLVLAWYRSFIGESEVTLSQEEKQRIEHKIWASVSATVMKEGERGKAQATKVVKMPSRRWYRWAVAGSLLLVAVAGWYLRLYRHTGFHPEQFTGEQVPEGYLFASSSENGWQEVAMSDGSHIRLDPGSVVWYPAVFKGKTRDVYLSGDAFFEVAHDTSRHFIVHTNEGMLAEVLGTSFYISHDQQSHKIEVAVVTGRVSVYERKKKQDTLFALPANGIIITPNQKVTFKSENNQFTTSLVDDPTPVITAEQPASFAFEDAPLPEVLKALEKTYAITIETDDQHFSHCHFTGDLTRQHLYDKLDIICQSIQASYEVRGTTIYIKGKGCN
ncbi:FecR family protein [Chitinophaga sp. 30R24]|uniref:FecR family protein n=1 Tax=Chitinophaga sp. 30R24 TaxID=3248838 RepID=UPI003B9207C1